MCVDSVCIQSKFTHFFFNNLHKPNSSYVDIIVGAALSMIGGIDCDIMSQLQKYYNWSVLSLRKLPASEHWGCSGLILIKMGVCPKRNNSMCKSFYRNTALQTRVKHWICMEVNYQRWITNCSWSNFISRTRKYILWCLQIAFSECAC